MNTINAFRDSLMRSGVDRSRSWATCRWPCAIPSRSTSWHRQQPR